MTLGEGAVGRRYISFDVRGRFRKLSFKGYFFFLHFQENEPLDILFPNPNLCEVFFLKLNKIDFQRKNFDCSEVTHLVGSNLPSPQKRIKETSHSKDFPRSPVVKTLCFSQPHPKCFTISSWRQKLVDPHIKRTVRVTIVLSLSW